MIPQRDAPPSGLRFHCVAVGRRFAPRRQYIQTTVQYRVKLPQTDTVSLCKRNSKVIQTVHSLCFTFRSRFLHFSDFAISPLLYLPRRRFGAIHHCQRARRDGCNIIITDTAHSSHLTAHRQEATWPEAVGGAEACAEAKRPDGRVARV